MEFSSIFWNIHLKFQRYAGIVLQPIMVLLCQHIWCRAYLSPLHISTVSICIIGCMHGTISVAKKNMMSICDNQLLVIPTNMDYCYSIFLPAWLLLWESLLLSHAIASCDRSHIRIILHMVYAPALWCLAVIAIASCNQISYWEN